MLNAMKNFLRDEEGASAIEYGLIVGLIAVVIVGVLIAIGGTNGGGLLGLFNDVNDALVNAQTP